MQSRDEVRHFFSRQTGALARSRRYVGSLDREPLALVSTPSFQIRIPQSLLHILLETDSLEDVLAIHWSQDQLNALDPRIRVVARYPVLGPFPRDWVRIELTPSRPEEPEEEKKDRFNEEIFNMIYVFDRSCDIWVPDQEIIKPSLAVVRGRPVDEDDLVDQETAGGPPDFRLGPTYRLAASNAEPEYVVQTETKHLYSFRVGSDPLAFTGVHLCKQILDTSRIFDSIRDRTRLPILIRRVISKQYRVFVFLFVGRDSWLCITMQSQRSHWDQDDSGICCGFGRILLFGMEKTPLGGETLRKKKIALRWNTHQLEFEIKDLAEHESWKWPWETRVTVETGLDPEHSESQVLINVTPRKDSESWDHVLDHPQFVLLESRSPVAYRPSSIH